MVGGRGGGTSIPISTAVFKCYTTVKNRQCQTLARVNISHTLVPDSTPAHSLPSPLPLPREVALPSADAVVILQALPSHWEAALDRPRTTQSAHLGKKQTSEEANRNACSICSPQTCRSLAKDHRLHSAHLSSLPA